MQHYRMKIYIARIKFLEKQIEFINSIEQTDEVNETKNLILKQINDFKCVIL